jgi:diadenosine tetraphosphate (Ap4A) HIT family hydrolase
MPVCPFCALIAGKAETSELHRDERAIVFMDIQPTNPAHVLVVPIEHCARLSDLEPETGAHLFQLAQGVVSAIYRSSLSYEACNLHLSDGELAGQEVMHLHLHVVPRAKGDGIRFGGGQRRRPDRADLDALGRRIREAWELDS